MNYRIVLTIALLIFGYFSAEGQTKELNEGRKSNWKRVPKYYIFGVARPVFADTKELYGFKIKFKGCLVKNRNLRRNKQTIKILNNRFGENWFEQNIERIQNL